MDYDILEKIMKKILTETSFQSGMIKIFDWNDVRIKDKNIIQKRTIFFASKKEYEKFLEFFKRKYQIDDSIPMTKRIDASRNDVSLVFCYLQKFVCSGNNDVLTIRIIPRNIS